MTKADVMSGFNTIKICTSYRIEGKECVELPFNDDSEIEPIYTTFPGWKEDITGIKEFNELPEALKSFIVFIETNTGVPITLVSVGPDREETIFRS
jgi:adenylosuccinate synthase